MDFKNLNADINLWLNKHFTSGRSGREIEYVVLHHNAGNLTVQGCLNVWQTRQASAHYQVQSDGIIGQLVHDKDTAWACGNWDANCKSISIEHADCSSNPWRISDKCLESGAHLVAAICLAYGLGRPQWLKNVFPHSHFSSTACPASLQSSQKDAYIKRAQEWYDAMTKGTSAPAASKPSESKPAASSGTDLGDTNWTGPLMTKEWQRQLGCEVIDGIISGQTSRNRKNVLKAVTSASGDGIYSTMVKKLQSFLIKRGYSVGSCGSDGHFGSDTVKALQRFLNAKLGLKLDVDGIYGNATSRGVGTALQKRLFAA